jgi:hypothetical protein
MTLKGQYIEKIKYETLNWPRKNYFQLSFMSNLQQICSLRIWRIL